MDSSNQEWILLHKEQHTTQITLVQIITQNLYTQGGAATTWWHSSSVQSYPTGNANLPLATGLTLTYTAHNRTPRKQSIVSNDCLKKKAEIWNKCPVYPVTLKKLKSLMFHKTLTAYKFYYWKDRGKVNKGRHRKICRWVETNQRAKKYVRDLQW